MNEQEAGVQQSEAPPLSDAGRSGPHAALIEGGILAPPQTLGIVGSLGRFDILNFLGEGAVALVYVARDPATDKKYAVRVLHPRWAADPQTAHHFLVEARHMQRLDHPHILRVIEVSETDEKPYYVMPFLADGSVRRLYEVGESLPDRLILTIACEIASALAHAHAHGIIHRALKPGNILLTRTGHAYLADFGQILALSAESDDGPACDHLIASAAYLSPGVARGGVEDTRCDIYAFGALLYEWLTGRPPYVGTSVRAILEQIVQGPPPPVLSIRPKARPELVRVAEGCMARELRDRYASMQDVARELSRISLERKPRLRDRRFPVPLAVALPLAAAAAALILGADRWATKPRLEVQPDPRVNPRLARRAPETVPTAGNVPSGTRTAAGAVAAPPVVQSPLVTEAAPSPPPLVVRKAEAGGFVYRAEGGTVAITRYTGPGGEVAIPETIEGLPVTHIGDSAFKGRADITRVTFPEGIKCIDFFAFMNCARLQEVILPDSVISIGEEAFRDCSHLTRLAFGERLADIGRSAFRGCIRLANFSLPASVVNIWEGAFQGCASLSRLEIPDASVQIMMWWGAFAQSGLTNVVFSKRQINLSNPFEGCQRLQSFTIDKASRSFSTDGDGVLFDYKRTRLIWHPLGRTGVYVVPDGITRIENGAFKMSSRLTEIHLPVSVTSVGKQAFVDCHGLTQMTFPSSVTEVGDHVFVGCRQLARVTLPRTTFKMGYGLFMFCPALKEVDFGSGVMELGGDLFRGCKQVERLVFGGDAPTIQGDSFKGAPQATVYRPPDTRGWGHTFGGRPVMVWDGQE